MLFRSVYMIGFQPGFTYLGGLDPKLHLPRRETPRLKTPAGTISVGGIQAAVASIEAPSGWHLLGRTPVRAFDPSRSDPFLFRAGDRIRFERISADDYAQIRQLYARTAHDEDKVGSGGEPHHFVYNVRVEGYGTAATGRAHVIVATLGGQGRQTTVMETGEYRDELVKTAGVWQIKTRKLEAR